MPDPWDLIHDVEPSKNDPVVVNPLNGEPMRKIDIGGVKIDRCETTGAIWLDRGELDKILERAEPKPASAAKTGIETKSIRPKRERDDDDDDDDDRKRSKRTSRDSPYRKRKDHVSFIKDIFDF